MSARVHEAPAILLVLDGWGEAEASPGNAVVSARPTALDALRGTAPRCLLQASGRAVGLPEGVMGNSEVGHLTLGSGRVVDQDLVRISEACSSGALATMPAVRDVMAAAKSGSGRLHLLGLLSDAGVHSDVAHMRALIETAVRAGVENVYVHGFTDGRDTPPDSGGRHVAELEAFLAGQPRAHLATLGGRYYAMDRDNRWDRIELALRTMVLGEGERLASGSEAVRRARAAGISDEFIAPAVIDPRGLLVDGDAVIFTNFRADRGRQLTRALLDPAFTAFTLPRRQFVRFASMTEYSADLRTGVLFPRQVPRQTVGQVFADAGWPQLRLAETEKVAHVTYFFNGGGDVPMAGEERRLVPSPRVATYDEAPAMSALAITEIALEWIARGGQRFLVMNLANADMVGHTGKLSETIEACRVVDRCVAAIASAAARAGALLVVTADHGNAEHMLDERGLPHTAHTTSPVPCFVAIGAERPRLRATGGLADVAPTILHATGLPVPAVMTGRSLLCD